MIRLELQTPQIFHRSGFVCKKLGQELAARNLPWSIIVAIVAIFPTIFVIVKHSPPLSWLCTARPAVCLSLSLASHGRIFLEHHKSAWLRRWIILVPIPSPAGLFEIGIPTSSHDLVVGDIPVDEPIVLTG